MNHIFKILAVSVIVFNFAQSQNTVSMNLQSVPSMTPAHSGIVLRNVNDNAVYKTETDSLTGNASLDVPSGMYERIIQTINHRRFTDTINVNSDYSDSLQMIQPRKTDSQYFTDDLDLMNCLLDNYGSQGVSRLFRWRDDNLRIRFSQETQPDSQHQDGIELAVNDIYAKTNGAAGFREAIGDSVVNVLVRYVPRSTIPFNGSGWTIVDSKFDDRTPKHMTVLIADDGDISRGTFLREFCRVLRLFNTSPDPMHVMLREGTIVQELSRDEGHAIELLYKLKMYTDTRKYKNIVDSTITDVKEISRDVPKDFELGQNYPNPFNPTTSISFDLPYSSNVRLAIYNSLGQEVSILINYKLIAGNYTTTWDAVNLPSGVYYYRLVTNSFVQVRKMVLTK